ncbi:hypothetical protein A3F38_01870 [Candidatus Saccharibacteria bacterium RIFCSPHIGHO2_12_FULL_48_21]|nr:MAG: hypothetical protein A3F38_01870 [Candidatus Saccharibacteria bacterium RIFCSPHIGHO2_12_FULL_48_21]
MVSLSFGAEVLDGLFCAEEDEDDESSVAEVGVIGITAGTLDLKKFVTLVSSKIANMLTSNTTTAATMAGRVFNRWLKRRL